MSARRTGMPIADAVNIRDRNPWPSVTANRLAGRQFLSHLQVMLQRRQRPTGPILELRIVTACRIAFEQRNRILVTAHLIRIVARTEIGTVERPQLFELALVGTIERGGQ